MRRRSLGLSPVLPPSDLQRRAALAWLGAAAAAALAQARSVTAAARGASPPPPTTTGGVPRESAEAGVERYMKLHAATTDGIVPWYYTGRIYAMRERQAPVHLFNLEGSEIYWVRRVGTHEWRTTSSTLTFYRDKDSGVYLDAYANPLTGRTAALYPNVLRTAPGKFSSFSAAGQDAVGDGASPWSVELHRNGGTLWLVTSRALASAPQPWIEVQTMFGDEAQIDDPRNGRPDATFSSSYSAPYLKWMQMDDQPGHLLWHSSGRKLRGLEQLPADYRARAERLQPAHFTAPGASAAAS